MSQWPKWLRRQYGKLEICGSSPDYDTKIFLSKIINQYTYINIFLADVIRVVRIGPVAVHVLESLVDTLRVQRVVVAQHKLLHLLIHKLVVYLEVRAKCVVII